MLVISKEIYTKCRFKHKKHPGIIKATRVNAVFFDKVCSNQIQLMNPRPTEELYVKHLLETVNQTYFSMQVLFQIHKCNSNIVDLN